MVKEDWIARAILHLVEQERFVVEGAGACPLAAILGNLVPELKSKKYGLIYVMLYIKYTNTNLHCLLNKALRFK